MASPRPSSENGGSAPERARADRRSSSSWSSLVLVLELNDSRDIRAGSAERIIFRAIAKEDAAILEPGVGSKVDPRSVSVLALRVDLCLGGRESPHGIKSSVRRWIGSDGHRWFARRMAAMEMP